MIGLCLVLSVLGSQLPIDEDALFGDTTVVAQEKPESPRADTAVATKVRLGGSLDAIGQASWKREGLFPGSGEGAARLVGTASVDVRLAGGQRALGVFEVAHEANVDTTSWALRELFLDADIHRVVWFRAGKQVLQWGRGILWTPTDLVNVEGRTLVERAGAREGATGLKVQVPFGTRGSLSGFLPLREVDAFDSLALSVRGEFVLGDAEIAVSSWFKSDAPHVVGLDASRRILGLDVQGGALWSSGDLKPRAVLRDGSWHLESDPERAQVKASGGMGRAFRVAGKPDRLRIDLEGFWQSEGGAGRALADTVVRPFADTIWQPLDPRVVEAGKSLGLPIPRGIPATRGDGLAFLAGNGLYVPNQAASFYAGGMISFQDAFIADLMATVQLLANTEDGSGVGTLGMSWESLHGFRIQPLAYWFWGDRHTEFTIDGQGLALELRTGLRF